MKQALENTLTNIQSSQKTIRDLREAILGLNISVNDLSLKILEEGLTDVTREEIQADYAKDQQKMSETQDKLTQAEQKMADLMIQKNSLMTKIANLPHPIPIPGPGDPPPGPRQDHGVQGSQISSIPLFDGGVGVDGEAWIRMVDRAKDQFGWTSRQTAQTVRNRLLGEARMFVDNQEDEGIPGTLEWDETENNLRAMLIDKYGFTYSAATAAHALEDLKQNNSETVDQFYERVRFAVSKFLADMDKTGANAETYRNMFQRLTFTHFKGGIFQQYRVAIYSSVSARQPTTARALLEAARSAELEAGKSRKDVVFKKVAEVKQGGADMSFVSSGPDREEEDHKATEKGATAKEGDGNSSGSSNDKGKTDSETTVEELAKEMKEMKKMMQNQNQGKGKGKGGNNGRGRGGRGGFRGRGGRGRGGGRGNCHGCDQADHWWKYCPQNPNRAQGNQRFGGNYQNFQPYQGGAGPAFNPYQQGNRHNNELTFEEGYYEALN